MPCKANGDGCMDEAKVDGVSRSSDMEFYYHDTYCFKFLVPNLVSPQAINYDLAALNKCCKYIKEHNITHQIVYIMACRIGAFVAFYYHKLSRLGGKVYVKTDGHEWMRAMWFAPVRKYWKLSERMMVR